MARGRMISRTLGASKRFARLGAAKTKLAEFAQLLYPLIVINTDDFGRMKADAETVKWAVFPSSRREFVDFDSAMRTMHEVGLIVLYEVNGERFLQVVDFEAHQTGLHKRTHSRYPEPPEDSGKLRNVPSQENRTEEKVVVRVLTTTHGSEPTEPVVNTPSGTPDAQTSPDVGRFIKRFCELYTEHRNGAKYVINRTRHVPLVKRLLSDYGFDRLVILAEGLLTTDEAWVDSTDRGISVLHAKANWLNERYMRYEARRRQSAPDPARP